MTQKSKQKTRNSPAIQRDNIIWLIVAQGFAILPLLFQLPFWVTIIWLFALIWRVQIYRGRAIYPNNMVKLLMGLSVFVGIFASYSGVKSVEPMVTLLVSAFVFKLIEMKTQKDGLLIIFIGFVAVATQFLFVQSMLSAAYGILVCLILIIAWETVYLERAFTIRYKINRGARILFHSMPLMLILFIVMPRINPLWSVPIPSEEGKTGFSDDLSIGGIGNLAKSPGVAFRVAFDEDSPRPLFNEWYWRGIVLNQFDGETWRRRKPINPSAMEFYPLENKEHYRYEIILEPHRQKWLFTLNNPLGLESSSKRAAITADNLISNGRPVIGRIQYSVVSLNANVTTPLVTLSDEDRELNLRLPKTHNPRTWQLANELNKLDVTPQEKMRAVLKLYNSSFYYTLQPPKLGHHSIDEFLFDTRRGFCEHFASSFVFIMRATGVPARIVVGYHGGTQSEVNDYLMVKQADAHAWAEVWLEDKGWFRVDPTVAVAPSRIEQGIDDALEGDDLTALGGRNIVETTPWMRRFAHRLDAMGYAWDRWVLNYSNEKKANLLKNLLGGVETWRIVMFVVFGFACVISVYALYLYSIGRKNRPTAPATIIFERFCKKLKPFNLERNRGESVQAFMQRVICEKPEFKSCAEKIANLYEYIAYAGHEEKLPLLKRYVRAFPKEPK